MFFFSCFSDLQLYIKYYGFNFKMSVLRLFISLWKFVDFDFWGILWGEKGVGGRAGSVLNLIFDMDHIFHLMHDQNKTNGIMCVVSFVAYIIGVLCLFEFLEGWKWTIISRIVWSLSVIFNELFSLCPSVIFYWIYLLLVYYVLCLILWYAFDGASSLCFSVSIMRG